LESLGDSKLSKKFQATVPKRVREILNLDTDDRLVFVIDHDEIVLKRGKINFAD
jgi:AbrB family looped-hinge helix DNA binding protein